MNRTVQTEATQATRPHHARRTAQSQAAFFLPHLRPGMALLDLGCGPGSITVGLAAAVAPSPTVGRRLRALLGEAGFVRCEGSARVMAIGTPDEISAAASGAAALYALPTVVDLVTRRGWASAEELTEMHDAWLAWGQTQARSWPGCGARRWAGRPDFPPTDFVDGLSAAMSISRSSVHVPRPALVLTDLPTATRAGLVGP